MNWLVTLTVPASRAFAVFSWSRGTIEGMSAADDVSNNVSPAVSRKNTA